MGVLKYDQPVTILIGCRVTHTQANSITAIAHSMSLTVADLIRASVDAWIEDVPEPRILTAGLTHLSKPRR